MDEFLDRYIPNPAAQVAVLVCVVVGALYAFGAATNTAITGLDAMIISAAAGGWWFVRSIRRAHRQDRETAPARIAARFDGSDFVSVPVGGLFPSADVTRAAHDRGYDLQSQARSEMVFKKRTPTT